MVLFFGLLRPYKGIDVLLDAWRGVAEGELWIVGLPRMDIAPLLAERRERVRFIARFVSDAELPAFFRRADIVDAALHGDRASGPSGVLADGARVRRARSCSATSVASLRSLPPARPRWWLRGILSLRAELQR